MTKPTIGSHRARITLLPPDTKPEAPTGDPRRSAALQKARRTTESLIDFGPLTPLIKDLSTAIEGNGPAWAELSQSVLKHRPKDLHVFELAFVDACDKAEKAVASGDQPAYRKALALIRTSLTMNALLR